MITFLKVPVLSNSRITPWDTKNPATMTCQEAISLSNMLLEETSFSLSQEFKKEQSPTLLSKESQAGCLLTNRHNQGGSNDT